MGGTVIHQLVLHQTLYMRCVLQISERQDLFLLNNFENTSVTFSGGRFSAILILCTQIGLIVRREHTAWNESHFVVNVALMDEAGESDDK